MSHAHVIQAWKDPAYRASLDPEVLARLPAHPAGRIGLPPAGLRNFLFSVFCLNTYQNCSAYGDNLWVSEFP